MYNDLFQMICKFDQIDERLHAHLKDQFENQTILSKEVSQQLRIYKGG